MEENIEEKKEISADTNVDTNNVETKMDYKKKIIPIVVLVLVVLALVGYFVFGKNKINGLINNNLASVATVNGVKIPKTAYDTQLATSLSTYKAQGIDVTDATKLSQIKTQVLDNLIGDELLNQAVAAAKITVTTAEVEKQFQAVLTQAGGADALKAALTENKITEAQLRENISKQLAIQKYLLQNIDVSSITVTDAEIAQFYASYSKAQQASGSKTPVPPLKDLNDQIKQQLISDKQQTLVSNFIASLRAKATVETSTL